jgi:hypothetical protein
LIRTEATSTGGGVVRNSLAALARTELFRGRGSVNTERTSHTNDDGKG